MKTKRIITFIAGCSMLASVFMSTPISASAAATGVPAKPYISVTDAQGKITTSIYTSSGSNNATRWRLYENNKIIQSGAATDNTPSAQNITTGTLNKPSGTYTYRGEFINKYGSTFSDPKTITVSHGYIDPAPSQAIFTEYFESGINGWTKQSTQSSSTGIVESGTGTYGSNCLKITSTVASDTMLKKTISLTAGEKYRLSAYVKYSNVLPTANGVGPNICIDGTSYFGTEWINTSTSIGWKKITLNFTAPAASTTIALRLGHTSSYMTGVVLFDNIAIEHVSKEVLSESFEYGLGGWNTSDPNTLNSSYKVDTTSGYSGTKSLQINSKNFSDYGMYKEISGLVEGAYYEYSAYVKYSGVDAEIKYNSDGKPYKCQDAVNLSIWYPDCEWIRSDSEPLSLKNNNTQPESISSGWKRIKAFFQAPPAGVPVKLGLRLGYNWSCAKGTVWFDNVKVKRIDSDLVVNQGLYFKTAFTPYNMETITKVKQVDWMSNLDQVYALMRELVGYKYPYQGKKLAIIQTDKDPGGPLVSGNPILWYSGIRDQFTRTNSNNDMGFGPTHEIGHVFNTAGNSTWNWNDEMFANFRMYYALDQLGKAGTALNLPSSQKPSIYTEANYTNCQTATQLEAYYKKCYDESFGATPPKYHHDGVMYILIKIKNRIGWEPFYKTFSDFNSSTVNYSNVNNYTRFENFLKALCANGGIDMSTVITPQEQNLISSKI